MQLIVLLKPDSSCGNNFALSWVNKVTTGTWKICFSYCKCRNLICQLRLILQLIKGISRVLQKLLKHFNGIIISMFIILSSLAWPVIFALKLNESVTLAQLKSIILPLGHNF